MSSALWRSAVARARSRATPLRGGIRTVQFVAKPFRTINRRHFHRHYILERNFSSSVTFLQFISISRACLNRGRAVLRLFQLFSPDFQLRSRVKGGNWKSLVKLDIYFRDPIFFTLRHGLRRRDNIPEFFPFFFPFIHGWTPEEVNITIINCEKIRSNIPGDVLGNAGAEGS